MEANRDLDQLDERSDQWQSDNSLPDDSDEGENDIEDLDDGNVFKSNTNISQWQNDFNKKGVRKNEMDSQKNEMTSLIQRNEFILQK